MEDNKEQDENFDKIKVFSSDDERLKILGELLSNKSSRDIIKLLSNKEMYANEIAKKLDIRPNLVIHHLKKLKELGLLETKNKEIIKKGVEHKYYKIIPNMFVTLTQTKKEIHENGLFKRFFKEGVKFAVIGSVSAISWLLLQPSPIRPGAPSDKLIDVDPLVVALLIIISGLVIELIYLKIKK